MAQYLTAQDAKRISEESMGSLRKTLLRIEEAARQGEFECVFASYDLPTKVASELRELGFVVNPEGRTTYVVWK